MTIVTDGCYISQLIEEIYVEDVFKNILMTGYIFFKSCIWETLILLTDADIRTDTTLKKLHDCFLWRGCVTFLNYFLIIFFCSLFLLLSPQLEAAPALTSPPSPSSSPNKL